jgi:glutamine synthetase
MGITTFEELEAELKNDTKIKVAGIDADGVMRGKVMAKDKFMSAAKSGFGFCRYPQLNSITDLYSVIFGWDIHDKVPYSLASV